MPTTPGGPPNSYSWKTPSRSSESALTRLVRSAVDVRTGGGGAGVTRVGAAFDLSWGDIALRREQSQASSFAFSCRAPTSRLRQLPAANRAASLPPACQMADGSPPPIACRTYTKLDEPSCSQNQRNGWKRSRAQLARTESSLKRASNPVPSLSSVDRSTDVLSPSQASPLLPAPRQLALPFPRPSPKSSMTTTTQPRSTSPPLPLSPPAPPNNNNSLRSTRSAQAAACSLPVSEAQAATLAGPTCSRK